MSRTILHADMDAFYASIEERDDPALRGRPVVVGGPARRGVVAAASYEARRFGIHSAMPMAQATRRCRELVVVRPRMRHYARVSEQVFGILGRYSPLVEPLSLDEAFLDITGTERLHGDAWEVARRIKREVRDELDLVVSIGVGPSKLVAKIASDAGKPDGLVVVRPDETEAFLHPRPVGCVFGVGQVTLQVLSGLGIRTVGDLAAYPREVLRARLGEHGEQLWALAHGIDERAVLPEREPRSVGHEDTFADDIADREQLCGILLEQADRVARRLRQSGLRAQVVVLKARTARFRTITRRRTLERPTWDGTVLGRVAGELLTTLMQHERGPFRLIGVSGTNLVAEAPGQLTFDESDRAREDRLGPTLDAITERFGDGAIARASTLGRKKPPPDEDGGAAD